MRRDRRRYRDAGRGRVLEQDGRHICSECRRSVDQQTRRCPHCESRLKAPRDVVQKLIIGLGGLGMVISIGLFIIGGVIDNRFVWYTGVSLATVTAIGAVSAYILYYILMVVIGMTISVINSTRSVGRVITRLFR